MSAYVAVGSGKPAHLRRVLARVILSLLTGAAGALVVLIALSDVFQSVVVPRPITRWRPSAAAARAGWQLWRALANRIGDLESREEFLGTFAPLLLVGLLALWVCLLIAGFALIFFALRDQLQPAPATLGGAAYYAGTALLTLGFGDITATGGLARTVSLLAAASGLATLAIVTSFLFAIFAAFQRRETFMVALRERMGAPPSGIEFIERHNELQLLDDIGEVFRDAQYWAADVLETHLAYPILTYFRSTHDGQSWVGTLGALLDASTIAITVLDAREVGQSTLFNRVGRHLVNDASHYFGLDATPQVGIDRNEFMQVYDRLATHGAPLRPADEAWERFAALRATYAAELNLMARYFDIPPAQWVSDRSLVAGRHTIAMPNVAA